MNERKRDRDRERERKLFVGVPLKAPSDNICCFWLAMMTGWSAAGTARLSGKERELVSDATSDDGRVLTTR